MYNEPAIIVPQISPPIKEEEKFEKLAETHTDAVSNAINKISSNSKGINTDIDIITVKKSERKICEDPAIVSMSGIVKEIEYQEEERVKKNIEEIIIKEKEPERIPEKIYSLGYLFQFRAKCQKRPKDMRPIDMPLKSNVNIDFSPYNNEPKSEFAETIRNLRILLNKLAKDNFARISDTILNNFDYTPEILKELARILFNKCIKESNYIDLYMNLADQLFIKFPKENKKKPLPVKVEDCGNYGMYDFKRTFCNLCQDTFRHEENQDFLKEMPNDLDEEEKKQKLRQRNIGNIRLIGQLFIRDILPEIAVKQCLEAFLQKDKEENIEHACILILIIGKRIYERFAFDAGQTATIKRKPKLKLKSLNKELFEEYIDKLISYKQADFISSRIKFIIQDVIDARNQDWNNAFDFFKLNEGVAFKKKTKSIEKQEENMGKQGTASLETDPKIVQRESRKKSMNEQNAFGKNLEKFLKTKCEEKTRVFSIFYHK